MILNNIGLRGGFFEQLADYYDKAKAKADFNKGNFQSVKDNLGVSETKTPASSKAKTLDEFKREVYSVIDAVPITGLAGACISIDISDDAFEKMMNDEKFMKEQLGALIKDLGCPANLRYRPAYVVFKITKNGYKCTSYGSRNKVAFDNKGEDSFWEKRRKKFKETMKEREEYALKKKLKMKNEEIDRLNAVSAAKRIAVFKGDNPLNYNKYMYPLFSADDLFDFFM